MTDTKPITTIHQPNRPIIHRRGAYSRPRGYYNSSWSWGSWWPWGYGYRNRGRGPYGSTGNHGHDYMGEAPYRHTHEHGHPANDIDDDGYYDDGGDPDGLWLCFVFWFVLILLLLFLPLIFWGGYGHHGHHHASDDEFTNAVCEALPDCVAFQDLLDRVALLEAAAP